MGNKTIIENKSQRLDEEHFNENDDFTGNTHSFLKYTPLMKEIYLLLYIGGWRKKGGGGGAGGIL
jgi:hypothetical protein